MFDLILLSESIRVSDGNHMEDYKVLSGKKLVLANRRDVQTLSYVYISAEKVQLRRKFV